MAYMKPIRALLVFLWVLPWPGLAGANENDLQELKKEVQELRKTVEDLKTIVQTQHGRIEQLEGGRKPATSSPADKAPETIQAAASPSPEPYRQLGFWKVPVSPSGPSRFIPDISVNGIFAAAYFQDDPNGETGPNPSRTGFNLQEIELAIQSVIDPYIRADVFISFQEEEVEVEEAYITSLSLPKGLQVKGGLYQLPFGRQNPKHVEQWAFVNDNLINQRIFGVEQFRELGFEISYLFPTPFYLLLQADMTNGDNEGNFDSDDKEDFAYTWRLSGSGDLSENLTLLAGTSGSFGFNNTGSGNDTLILGGDLLLSWRPSAHAGIDWQTEYIFRRREVPLGFNEEGGLYSYLIGNWSKRWGAGMRVGYVGMPKLIDSTFRLSPMVVFRTTEWFQVKAQYDFVDDSMAGVNHSAFLQWIFTMGPHAPHPF